MNELLERARARLEKHREELRVAEEELAALEPLKASLREEADREVEELFAFAEERGHAWVGREEDAVATRRLLVAGSYHAAVHDESSPIPGAEEKVRRLEGKVKWWTNKILKEEVEARKAEILRRREEG